MGAFVCFSYKRVVPGHGLCPWLRISGGRLAEIRKEYNTVKETLDSAVEVCMGIGKGVVC